MSRRYIHFEKLKERTEAQDSGAIFDRGRQHRFILWRQWDLSRPAVSFIMLNPSAADEHHNDPTIARSLSLAQDLNFGRLYVVNLFAYMTKSPALLKATYKNQHGRNQNLIRHQKENLKGHLNDHISGLLKEHLKEHLNDQYIRFAIGQSEKVVLAWGNHGLFLERHKAVLEMLKDSDCFVFDITKLGQPRHPLYTPHSISLRAAPPDLWI